MKCMRKFPNIDFNLLKLFASLYHTASVTTTAEHLNLSQSACSHALTRLRERLGDELFVRVDNRMIPTERAVKLAEDILPSLNSLCEALERSPSFSPNDAQLFTLAVTDYTSWCMRAFLSDLNRRFPSIRIDLIQLESRLPEQLLEEGDVDFACGFTHQEEASEALAKYCWLEDEYAAAMCNSHPLNGQLDLEGYLNYPHILVAPWNEQRGITDIGLAKIKKKRHVALRTVNVLTAPYFLQGSSLILSVPRIYAEQIKDQLDLSLAPLPFDVPKYQLNLYWHKTRSNSAKVLWFIKEFKMFHQKEGDI